MQRKTYNKLVRDSIPDIIKADGGKPCIKVLDDVSYETTLRQKVIEEAHELAESATDDEIMNELADIMEILESIMKHHRLSLEDVNRCKETKKQKRGGFDKKIFLEYSDEE